MLVYEVIAVTRDERERNYEVLADESTDKEGLLKLIKQGGIGGRNIRFIKKFRVKYTRPCILRQLPYLW